jgi:hypothetical protein
MTEVQESGPAQVEPNDVHAEDSRKRSHYATLDELQSLAAGSQIEVTRLAPTTIKGYCGNLVVPDGGMSDLLDEIKQSWGGGKYQLRGKCLAPNGRQIYAVGAVQIDVAGYPRADGKEWLNGVWRPIAMPSAGPMVIAPQVGGGGQPSGIEALLGPFLQQALASSLSGDGGVSFREMPALITAIAGLTGNAPQRDSFTDLERSLAIMQKLQSSREPERERAEPKDDLLGGLGQLLPLLIAKFSQPTPAPAPHPQYQYMPPPPPYGAISSAQLWEQMQAHGYAPPAPQPPAMPGNWTAPSNVEHTQGQPSGYRPPKPRDGLPISSDDDESEEYEPLSVDDIIADMAQRDDAGRMAFLGELCSAMGIDQAIVKDL